MWGSNWLNSESGGKYKAAGLRRAWVEQYSWWHRCWRNATRQALGSEPGGSIPYFLRSDATTKHGWKSGELVWTTGSVVACAARDTRKYAWRWEVEFRG